MGNRPKPKKPSPLRAALAQKTNLQTYFDIAVADTEAVEEAQRVLVTAQQIAAGAMLGDDADVKARAKELLDEAKAHRAECFHRVWFRGLPFDEFDALVALHPPTDEQRRSDEQHAWNPDTFVWALLEECVVDGDLTADEWKAELGSDRWTSADRQRFLGMAIAAQRQTLADAIPKD